MSESCVVPIRSDVVAEPKPAWLPVFTDEALSGLRRKEEPPTAGEAELAGPWHVVELGERDYGLFQPGEREAGVEPLVRVSSRSTALLAAAALPGLGRSGRYGLDEVSNRDRFALARDGESVGSCSVFFAELAVALDGLEAIIRSPEALARLLEAAGSTALEQAGRRLGRRLAAGRGSDEAVV